jgi:hypothetical protein
VCEKTKFFLFYFFFIGNDCDLFTTRFILRKQIGQISGEKENIVVPRMTMEQIRDGEFF